MHIRIFIFQFAFFLLVLIASQPKTYAQQKGDLDWWTDKHNWDGHTPWFNMMTTSAAYLGPNALPVPSLREGLVEQQYSVEFRPEAHLSKGDQTYNLYTSVILPLGGVASFEVFLVPVEYYKMDTLTRDERLARNYNAEGQAGGDFWFGTNVQILKGKRFPDMVFSAYFKTASGTNLSDARYTDAPAYYFLLNAGKTIYYNTDTKFKIRVYGNIGAYIWQTWSSNHSQDDALTYGLGVRFEKPKYFARMNFAGYYGYLNNGDRPNVLRVQAGTHNRKLNVVARYQMGLNDFEYHTFGLALIYQFGGMSNE